MSLVALVAPPGQLGHDLADFFACVAVKLVGIATQGLRPDLKRTDTVTLHSALGLCLKPLPATVEVHVLPVLWQQSVQVLGHDALAWIFLFVGCLDFSGMGLQLFG